MTVFKDRVIRAAKLDPHLYEEVEADKKTISQAMGVVILSGVAAGIGAFRNVGLEGVFLGTVVALIGWYLWAFLTFFIGTRLFPEPQTHADLGEMLRTIGFSSAPGLLRVFGILPGAGAVVFPAATLWMLAAMVVAVRQALDFSSTWRAVGVCGVGWLVQNLLFAVLFLLLRGAS